MAAFFALYADGPLKCLADLALVAAFGAFVFAFKLIRAIGDKCFYLAFILFTSHRALRRGAELLAGRIDNPILIQGDEPRSILLEQFRKLGNAVLLGTGSFWEGVDVRGEALSCVIIDKLPFASPGDPILQARIDAMR